MEDLDRRGVGLVMLFMGGQQIDIHGKLMLTMLAAIAEFEHRLLYSLLLYGVASIVTAAAATPYEVIVLRGIGGITPLGAREDVNLAVRPRRFFNSAAAADRFFDTDAPSARFQSVGPVVALCLAAPGPGTTRTSRGSTGWRHSEQTRTGSNSWPHVRCRCSNGRPQSSAM